MGKSAGLIGALTGKVGNVVFYKGDKGQTFERAYVAHKANPRTQGQSIQRAKMNLVGQISALVPKEILTLGLPSARNNRAEFNRSMLGLVDVDTTNPGVFEARIDTASIVFSKGAETLHASVRDELLTANGFSMDLTLGDTSLANKYGERIICLVTSVKNRAGVAAVVYEDVILTGTTPESVTVHMPFVLTDGDMLTVHRVPFVLTDEGRGMYTSRVWNNTTEAVAELQKTSTAVRGFGASYNQFKQVFTQA